MIVVGKFYCSSAFESDDESCLFLLLENLLNFTVCSLFIDGFASFSCSSSRIELYSFCFKYVLVKFSTCQDTISLLCFKLIPDSISVIIFMMLLCILMAWFSAWKRHLVPTEIVSSKVESMLLNTLLYSSVICFALFIRRIQKAMSLEISTSGRFGCFLFLFNNLFLLRLWLDFFTAFHEFIVFVDGV